MGVRNDSYLYDTISLLPPRLFRKAKSYTLNWSKSPKFPLEILVSSIIAQPGNEQRLEGITPNLRVIIGLFDYFVLLAGNSYVLCRGIHHQ